MRRRLLIICTVPVACLAACSTTVKTTSSGGSTSGQSSAVATGASSALSKVQKGDKVSAADMSRAMSNAAQEAGTVVATGSDQNTTGSPAKVEFKDSIDCKAKTAVITQGGKLVGIERDGKLWAATTETHVDYVKAWCEAVATGENREVTAADDSTVTLNADTTVSNRYKRHAVDRLERSTGRLLDETTTYAWEKTSSQTTSTMSAHYGDPVTVPTIPSSWKSVTLP